MRALPALNAALTDGTIDDRARRACAQARPIRIVLWPLHAVVAPVFARTPEEWRALDRLGAACSSPRTTLWVMRTGVAFEEAAMQRSERIAAQRAATRHRGGARARSGRAWFLLPPPRRRRSAIVWKNATALQRLVPLGRVAAVSVALLIVIVAWLPSVGASWSADLGWQIIRTVALIVAGVFVMLGPVYVRTDLQQDMLMLPLLKSYPLSGASIVAGEIASTVAILSVIQAVLLTIGFPLLVELAGGPLSVPIAIAGLFALPAITALRVAVANGWAILLPGWIASRTGARGGHRSARPERRLDPRILPRARAAARHPGGLRAAGRFRRTQLDGSVGDGAGGGGRRGDRRRRTLAGGALVGRRAARTDPSDVEAAMAG